MSHPDWVLKHKKKGTLIMKRDDRYYLYRVSSHWNKEKKRSQLRTDEYLGRITPDGLVEPKAKIFTLYTVKQRKSENMLCKSARVRV